VSTRAAIRTSTVRPANQLRPATVATPTPQLSQPRQHRRTLSRGSVLKWNHFKEFQCCTEPRRKWNRIILAAKI